MMKAEKTKPATQAKPAEFETIAIELISIRECFNECVNTGLSANGFLSFIELQLQIDDLIKKRLNTMKILMNSYGIEKPEEVVTPEGRTARWVYDKHEKATEIQEKLEAINNQKVKLTPANFLSAEEFHNFTATGVSGKALPMSLIVHLSKVLLKK